MNNLTTTITDSLKFGATDAVKRVQPAGSLRFDWAVAVLGGWLVGGFYLDVWAHHHMAALETFFTPWHGVLYSGFLAVAGFLMGAAVRNRLRGLAWAQALPAGYGLSLLGVLIFAAAGVGDMVWHQLFGIEVDLEAILSPTHLALILGGGLILSGPLRAAWQRLPAGLERGWTARLPMLISLGYLLTILAALTEYASVLVKPWPAVGYGTQPVGVGQALGVAGILLQTGLLMGTVLAAVRRWALQPGSLVLVLTLGMAPVSLVHDQYLAVLVVALAGLAADLLLWGLEPSAARARAFRLFAFAVPVALYALYFLALMGTAGTAWSVHLWAGSIALAGALGWLLSYAFVPPAAPVEQW